MQMSVCVSLMSIMIDDNYYNDACTIWGIEELRPA